jgi:hypothetical protein
METAIKEVYGCEACLFALCSGFRFGCLIHRFEALHELARDFAQVCGEWQRDDERYPLVGVHEAVIWECLVAARAIAPSHLAPDEVRRWSRREVAA